MGENPPVVKTSGILLRVHLGCTTLVNCNDIHKETRYFLCDAGRAVERLSLESKVPCWPRHLTVAEKSYPLGVPSMCPALSVDVPNVHLSILGAYAGTYQPVPNTTNS